MSCWSACDVESGFTIAVMSSSPNWSRMPESSRVFSTSGSRESRSMLGRRTRDLEEEVREGGASRERWVVCGRDRGLLVA